MSKFKDLEKVDPFIYDYFYRVLSKNDDFKYKQIIKLMAYIMQHADDPDKLLKRILITFATEQVTDYNRALDIIIIQTDQMFHPHHDYQ